MNGAIAQPVKLHRLHELLAAATVEASAAMSRWTSGSITLSLNAVAESPLEEATAELGLGDAPLTMVVLTLQGEMGGQMILAFDEFSGRQLAAMLLSRPVAALCEEGTWSPLAQSALNETGNILGCAYLNALSRLIAQELVPSPPYFVQDFGASVLEQALLMQAIDQDSALVCQTTFECDGRQLDWKVFFVPSATLRQSMETAMN